MGIHAATPTPSVFFPSASHFTNMDYLFYRKNDNEDPELGKDPYPWILWYIWRGSNDKLFRRIDKNPLKTVRMLNLNVMLGIQQTENKKDQH